jgi:hypothetical protein
VWYIHTIESVGIRCTARGSELWMWIGRRSACIAYGTGDEKLRGLYWWP